MTEKQKVYQREYALKNSEKKRLAAAAWRAADPERSQRSRAASYWNNWHDRKAQRDSQREKLRERGRQWRRAHLAIDAAKSRRRHARKRGAEGTHSLDEFMALCQSLCWMCFYCNTDLTPTTVTEDHIVPIVKGGSNDISNIVPACRSCNSAKRATDFAVFFLRNRAAQNASSS